MALHGTTSVLPTNSVDWDLPSVLSVVFALSLGPAAQLLAYRFLPSNVPRKTYYLFLWHTYDALTHFVIEGAYLYHSFFTYITVPAVSSDYPHPASLSSYPQSFFLGRADRRYGAMYGSDPLARIWKEYAKADRRWGENDGTVIALEILTVLVAGPAALYIAYSLSRLSHDTAAHTTRGSKRASTKPTTATASMTTAAKAALSARMHFVMIMLATGELYGGFMTFAPEWLTGSTALDTSNPIYLWVYLFFFNVLWVFIPAWVLWEVYGEVVAAYRKIAAVDNSEKKK